MTPSPPDRWKDQIDLSPDEIVRERATGRRTETEEYRAYVRRVHEAAGLEPSAEHRERPVLEDMNPEDHLRTLERSSDDQD